MLKPYWLNPEKPIDFRYVKRNEHTAFDFHLHEEFEIYFFISGHVNYFVEKKVYPLKYGDLLVMNSHEIHKPSFQDNSTYERITIHFDPSILQPFNTPECGLLKCFVNRPTGEQNKLSLSKEQIEEIMPLFQKLGRLQAEESEYSKILELTCFIELLVFINKAFERNNHKGEYSNIPDKLIPILDYIDKNLENDLTLETFEKKFFINTSYLSRLFKKSIGSNIHEYIVYKRISKAKKLIADGLSATETCSLCGFNDFSNFSRIFKRTVGMSLRQYKMKAKSLF